MTYALAQGARLWHNAGYAQLAHAMAELILREEVSLIPGLGATLLPGAKGFVAQQTWRLNASYAPIEVLRALERSSDERQWAAVARVLTAGHRSFGAAGFCGRLDPVSRVQRLLGRCDHRRSGKLRRDPRLSVGGHACGGRSAGRQPGAAAQTDGRRRGPAPAPASIDTNTLETRGEAPPGFVAALLPLLVHFRFTDAVQAYRQRIEAESLKDNQHYYSDAITLFRTWLARGPLPLRSTR